MNGVDVEAINQEHQEKSFTLSESQLDTTINSESHTTTDSKPMESSKKPVTIRWHKENIYLGAFPITEGNEKKARARDLVRTFMKICPMPEKEWVMGELERLGLRVLTKGTRPKENSKKLSIRWQGEEIYLGVFPIAETKEKKAFAKHLTKAWMKIEPIPDKEWVVGEFGRLGFRNSKHPLGKHVTTKEDYEIEEDSDVEDSDDIYSTLRNLSNGEIEELVSKAHAHNIIDEKTPPPPSLLSYLSQVASYQMVALQQNSNSDVTSLYEKCDSSALVAMGVVVEEVITEMLMPFAHAHVSNFRNQRKHDDKLMLPPLDAISELLNSLPLNENADQCTFLPTAVQSLDLWLQKHGITEEFFRSNQDLFQLFTTKIPKK